MPVNVYAMVLIAILASIFISWKFNINLGILGLGFAYIIGCFVMKMKASELVALTPLRMVFQLIAITLFFAFPTQNGTMAMVANNILYKFRNRAWAFPFVLYFTGVILCMMGSPPPVTAAIIAVLGFNIASRASINPLLISAAAVYSGWGANIPYAMQGVIVENTIASVGYPESANIYTWKFFLCTGVVFLGLLIILYFILRGNKASAAEMEKPPAATREQKINMVIIIVTVGLAIVPGVLALFINTPAVMFMRSYFDFQMLSVLGTILCIFLKLGNEKKAIAGVPWSTIIMLSGISILLGVAQQAGVSDWLGSLVSDNLHPSLIGPMVCMFVGLLSFFAGGITVVFPMLSTMVPSLVASTGLAPSMLFVSMACGGNITTISPFSAGGAIVLANCPDQSKHKMLFTGQLAIAFAGMLVSMLLSYIGFFNILVK